MPDDEQTESKPQPLKVKTSGYTKPTTPSEWSRFIMATDTQDLLLACLLSDPGFHAVAPLIKPEFFWGPEAVKVAVAFHQYYTEHAVYPGLPALEAAIEQKYRRNFADAWGQLNQYLGVLKQLDTRGCSWLRDIVGEFCRQRALVAAIQSAAGHLKEGTVPEGGFGLLFEGALKVGLTGEPSPTLKDLVIHDTDPTDCLMGNRLLCRGGSLNIVGPTGAGKSSLAYQLAIVAALGRDFFGLKITRPLTTLILQCENDADDIKEMIEGIVDGLKLSDKDLDALDRIRIRTVDCVGDDFLVELSMAMTSEPTDLVIVDPILGFFAGDIRNQRDTAVFFRQGILRLARKHKVGLIGVHHVNKPVAKAQTVKLEGTDLAYAGTGSADISNATRATMVLESQGRYDVFRLSLGKRAQRGDFKDQFERPVKSILLRHSHEGICWELASELDAQEVKQAQDGTAKVLELVPERGQVSLERLVLKGTATGIGVNRIRSILKVLVQEQQIEEHEEARRGAPKSYSRPGRGGGGGGEPDF